MPSVATIELPEITSAAGIAEAHRRIVEASAAGELDLDDAARLAAGVERLASATIVAELHQRLERLEAARTATTNIYSLP
jgi:phosphoserine phosphatase